MYEIKISDASTNADMRFPSWRNVSVEATLESIEIDNHINTDMSENSDDSFHLCSVKPKAKHDEEIQNSQCNNICTEEKYIVWLSSLKSILVFCQECQKPADITKTAEKGSVLIISLLCKYNHDTWWHSQPLLQTIASGNLPMTRSILLSGNTFQRIKEMMDIANVGLFQWYFIP